MQCYQAVGTSRGLHALAHILWAQPINEWAVHFAVSTVDAGDILTTRCGTCST